MGEQMEFVVNRPWNVDGRVAERVSVDLFSMKTQAALGDQDSRLKQWQAEGFTLVPPLLLG